MTTTASDIGGPAGTWSLGMSVWFSLPNWHRGTNDVDG